MRTVLFAVAMLCAAVMTPQAVEAKSKTEIRTESKRVVDSHQREAILIYGWLKHTPEISNHQMRGATQNKVYILPPGHREAVYDAAGKLVQDGMNDGSYNYYPYDQPLNHFMYDTLPWLVWGGSKKDPTSQTERVIAYVEDLGRGISAMRKAQDQAVDLNRLQPHEVVALAMFIGAIEDGGAAKIYAYLADPTLEISGADGNAITQGLQKGLSLRLKGYKDVMALTPRLPDPPPA